MGRRVGGRWPRWPGPRAWPGRRWRGTRGGGGGPRGTAPLGGRRGGGARAAVPGPESVAGPQVARHAGRVWVAAVNSPSSVVLAGEREALSEVAAVAEAEGVRVRWLP